MKSVCWAADRRTERLSPCCGPGERCGLCRIVRPEQRLTAPPPLLSHGPTWKGGSRGSGLLGTAAAAGPSGLTTGPGVHGKAPGDPMRPSLRERLLKIRGAGVALLPWGPPR
ncbi:hypothetical protein NDU88_002820 [Pleurodeles waltl]|uniref:Uncharacterized protein n=1 Tax=Pleurodeles waltl TaxID=8319 RepID=A0AAV7TLR0_PLEWA|nr:hypothetical protein NDU88_002820 [Pleurodeles waltl]